MKVFDPDSDYEKHRDIKGNVHFVQNGDIFSVGHEYIGKAAKSNASKPVRQKEQTAEQKSAKDRASEKLKGFKEPEMPGEVKDALAENKEALAAEEHAE
jgi:hypothetical protein